jgi:uncharacterized protein
VVAGAYLDASAIVRWVAREPGWQSLEAFLARYPEQFSSRIAQIEVGRALNRLPDADVRALRERGNAILQRIGYVELGPPIAAVATAIGPPLLRSLDAIHFASYLALRPDVETFVTFDARLAEAARALGATVVP